MTLPQKWDEQEFQHWFLLYLLFFDQALKNKNKIILFLSFCFNIFWFLKSTELCGQRHYCKRAFEILHQKDDCNVTIINCVSNYRAQPLYLAVKNFCDWIDVNQWENSSAIKTWWKTEEHRTFLTQSCLCECIFCCAKNLPSAEQSLASAHQPAFLKCGEAPLMVHTLAQTKAGSIKITMGQVQFDIDEKVKLKRIKIRSHKLAN